MSFLGFAFLGLLLVCALTWFAYVKTTNSLTADAPVDVAITMPSEVEYSAAKGKLDELRDALRQDRATTIAFTAADLNALVARDPDFSSHKGRMRFEIANSLATIQMSVSLGKVPLPRMKHRWFNGSTRFRFGYDDSGFDFDPEWVEANGHQLSGGILRSVASGFNRSFTTSFEDAVNKNGSDVWRNVKSMTLEGEQLIITTRGEAPSA